MKKLILILLFSLFNFSGFCIDDPCYELKVEYFKGDAVAPGGQYGAAFAISENTLITCAHLVDYEKEEIFIKIDKDWIHCSLIKRDDFLDVAVLHIDQKIKFVELDNTIKEGRAKCNACRWGRRVEDVHVVICKDRADLSLNCGESGKAKEIDHGSSGSPIIKDDKVQGMICKVYENTKFFLFLDCERINKFLKGN